MNEKLSQCGQGLWAVNSAQADKEQFVDQIDLEVLFSFDGIALLFTTSDGEKSMLWYESAEDWNEEVIRFLVVETSAVQIDMLKSNQIPLYDALNQNSLHLVDVQLPTRMPIRAWRERLDNVPDLNKPEKLVCLMP